MSVSLKPDQVIGHPFCKNPLLPVKVPCDLSLISTYTFRMSRVKLFTLDMHKLVKPTLSDDKNTFHSVHI